MGGVADIKIWNESEHTLLLFVLDLLFRHFDRRKSDPHLSQCGRNRQHDRWDDIGLARVQDSGEWLRGEPCRRNRELEGPGSDVGKRELPVVAGQNLPV